MKLVCEKCGKETDVTEVSITQFFLVYLGFCKKCFAEYMDDRKERLRNIPR